MAIKKSTARKTVKRKAKVIVKKTPNSSSSGSAKYPRHSISKVLRIPQAIIDQNAGNECTVAESAGFVGVGNHGPYRVEVSSANKYGLLDSPSTGKIKPSDLAKRILRPQSESDELAGRRAAIQKAPQISEVYKHYRGENLPDEKFFKNTITETYGVPSDKAVEFREIFIESLTDAKLLKQIGEKTRVLDITEEGSVPSDKTDTLKKLEKGLKITTSDTCFVMQPFAAPLGDYYKGKIGGKIGTATVFSLTSKGKMDMLFIHATNCKGCSKRISASCHAKGQLQTACI